MNLMEGSMFFGRDTFPSDARRYYDEHGHVVVRGLIPDSVCDLARTAFLSEVKPYGGYIYRQTTQNPERHALSSAGYMLNPILNVQSLQTTKFPRFRAASVELLTHENLINVAGNFLGASPKIVQTMYFEGNPVTWAHQDTYYMDAEELGTMLAAWIAVEDIDEGAGRFYVYPNSHRIDMFKNGGKFDVAFNHDRYKKLVLDVIGENALRCEAPLLKKGDVLFWNSKTIHGSLQTTNSAKSRSSFTCHFIPESSRYLQFQSRIKPVHLRTINGVQVNYPKDQDVWHNRLMFDIETQFPKTFQFLKRLAIKAVTR